MTRLHEAADQGPLTARYSLDAGEWGLVGDDFVAAGPSMLREMADLLAALRNNAGTLLAAASESASLRAEVDRMHREYERMKAQEQEQWQDKMDARAEVAQLRSLLADHEGIVEAARIAVAQNKPGGFRGYYLLHDTLAVFDTTHPPAGPRKPDRESALDAVVEAVKARPESQRSADVNEALRKPAPVPMQLICPACARQHVDEGEWATRPHRTHLCSTCGHKWRPFDYATVGVPAKPVAMSANEFRARVQAKALKGLTEKAKAPARAEGRMAFDALTEAFAIPMCMESDHRTGEIRGEHVATICPDCIAAALQRAYDAGKDGASRAYEDAIALYCHRAEHDGDGIPKRMPSKMIAMARRALAQPKGEG